MTGMELGDKLCVFNLINEECCVQFSKMPHNAVAPWILLSTIRTHCARKGARRSKLTTTHYEAS